MNQQPSNNDLAKMHKRRLTLSERLEWCWLLMFNVAFRNCPDKHKSFYEYKLAKKNMHPF